MNTSYLRFSHVHVRRTPGVRDAGFAISDLSPGVNVIFGPNGAGKTTTCAVIERLLWPRLDDVSEYSATARYALDAAEWTVDLDAGRVKTQRDGRDATPPVLPPAEVRDRYSLALHELITSTNERFAQRIILESAGGYDIPRAASAIGAKEGPGTAARETKALKEAREKVRRALDVQASLRETEEGARALEPRVRESRDAAGRVELLGRAAAFVNARDDEQRSRRRVAEFPSQVAKLTGNEPSELAALDERLKRARESVRAERHIVDDSTREMADLLPRGPLPTHLTPALRETLKNATRLNAEIADLEQQRARAVAERGTERRALGDVVTEDQLRNIDARGIESLGGFAREAEQTRSRTLALDAELRLLEDDGPPLNRTTIIGGTALLVAWLRAAPAPGANAGARFAAIAAAVVAIVASAILAVRLNPAYGILALIGLVAAVVAWRRDGAGDDRPARQKEYERLELQRPQQWVDEHVMRLLGRLHDLLAAASEAERRMERRTMLRRNREELAAQERRLDERRRGLITALGVAPETQTQSVVWLVERIGRWQDANARVAAVVGDLAERQGSLESLVSGLGARLADFGYEDARDCATVGAAIDDLESRARGYETARKTADAATGRAEKAQQELESAAETRRDLLARAGLDEADTATLVEWAAQVAPLRDAEAELRTHVRALEDRAAELRRSSGYEAGLEDKQLDEIDADLRALALVAAEYESLHTDLVSIRQRVKSAAETHDLETALAEEKRCIDVLTAARHADIEAVIAAAVADLVQRETRDRHRPAVFHRARQLFTTITAGRYRLDITSDDEPTFHAYDETTRTGHTLDELSSATRVQLLLAVRVAFVEREEQGARLPLVLDEALATSDEARAQAIMEAVAMLATEGRQIFYLTSQADEVAKWVKLLGERGVQFATIDLGSVRRESGFAPSAVAVVTDTPARNVPAPGGMSYAEYGQALCVPALPTSAPEVPTAHLWYFLEDPNELFSLLLMGIDRLGALRNVVEFGGSSLVDGGSAVVERVECAARTMELVLELAAVGRGKVVNRSVLEASRALSERMIERVADVCAQCGGDATELLALLERGKAKGLNQKSRDMLRTYLDRNGFIDERPRLESGEIRARVLREVRADAERGMISAAHVERMLAWAGVVKGAAGGELASTASAVAPDRAG